MRFVPILALLLTYATTAFAYKEDTHFYAMYTMARYSGIGHEVALELCTANQWIDLSLWSAPMNPIPFIGGRSRRLFHFPSTRTAAVAMKRLIDARFLSETKPNNSMASELITEGMKRGNLLMVGAGVHVLQDSYSHAGYPAELGHGNHGYWPDRPWTEPDKYFDMIRVTFKALVAIRKLLPPEALDTSVADPQFGDAPGSQLNAETLADRFLAREDIKKLITKDVFADDRYQREAIDLTFKRAKKSGFIDPNADLAPFYPSEADFAGPKDIHTLLREMGQRLISADAKSSKKIINYEAVLEKGAPGLPLRRVPYQQFGEDKIIAALLDRLTDRLIPVPFSPSHKTQFEERGPLFKLEIELRNSNWRDLIERLYGEKALTFERQSLLITIADLGVRFWRKVTRAPAKVKPPNPAGEIVTMRWPDRIRWMGMMFKFEFLDMFLGKNRWRPDPDNLVYQFAEEFDKMIRDDEVKSLITVEEVAGLKELRAKMRDRLRLPAVSVCEGLLLLN